MVKCPACGFESTDAAQWCDFCKEPFRKATRAKPQTRKKSQEPEGGIPAEFLAMDSGEKMPSLPPWVRNTAWAILSAWVVLLMVLVGAYLGKQKALEQGAAVPRPILPR